MKLTRICVVVLLIALVELSAARPNRVKLVKVGRQFRDGFDDDYIDSDYGNGLDDDDLDLDEYDDDFDSGLELDNDLDDDDAGVNNSFLDETLAPTGTTLTSETVPEVFFRRGTAVGAGVRTGGNFGGARAGEFAYAGGRRRQRRFKP